jgi:hypothetical protein
MDAGQEWGKPSSSAEKEALRALADSYHTDDELVEEWNRLIDSRDVTYVNFHKMTLHSYV